MSDGITPHYPTLCPNCLAALSLSPSGLICPACPSKVIPVPPSDRHLIPAQRTSLPKKILPTDMPNLDAPLRLRRPRHSELKGDSP